jgi:small subunit ribosomal protein S7
MRKSRPKKRILLPDPKYKDPYVTRFVNNLMFSGKKNLAFKIFYDSLEIVGDKFKARRVGGATFQVPMEIRTDRKVSISMKNMISFARKRTGHSMAERLAAELMAAYKLEGGAYKKKEDTHRMAEANKAFAHFRF